MASFTGNISEWEWTRGNSTDAYSLSYDALSRITGSRLFRNGNPVDALSESGISYDSNGNLLSLTRIGESGSTINDLAYTYDGNRLTSLSDGDVQSQNYTYDADGNMTFDGRTGMSLTWNDLGLVKKVSLNDTDLVNYSYLADGTKVSALDGDGDGLLYLGSLIYRKIGSSISLESAGFAGGRFVAREISPGVSAMVPMIHVTDHLGSVRAVLDGVSGAVVETNDYYPFGSRWNVAADLKDDTNRFRYNSKEEQFNFGTPYIDYGARQYDPILGRWFAQDPLSEKYYSIIPYAFCGNNPINFIDTDGMDIYRYDDKSGTFHLYQETDDDYDQIAQFRYNKDTGEYELKTTRKGKIKVRMDNIEKGILSDGINLLTNSQVWSTNDVSIEGFQNFIIDYSDMVGREMGGYYYTGIGGTDIKYINSGMGKNNTRTMSYPGSGIFSVRRDLYDKVTPHTNWHTHPSNAENKMEPSDYDNRFKSKNSKHGLIRFIILTGGASPIEY